MVGNTRIRKRMIKEYGQKCFMEILGFVNHDKNFSQYFKIGMPRKLTYHHIKPRSQRR